MRLSVFKEMVLQLIFNKMVCKVVTAELLYTHTVLFVGFMLVINVCFPDVSFFALFYETEPETEPMQTSC